MKVIGLITGILIILLNIINIGVNIYVDMSDSYEIYNYFDWLKYAWNLTYILFGTFLIMFFASKST